MDKTTCYCYFAIKGFFEPEEITKRLNISPTKCWSAGDSRTDGSRHEFALWECGFTLVTYPDIEINCVDAVRELIGKETLLNNVKREFDVEFVLEIVPTICDGIPPIIDINKDLIRFCNLSDTSIDLDMYVYPFTDLTESIPY